jgi:hypothetical protein
MSNRRYLTRPGRLVAAASLTAGALVLAALPSFAMPAGPTPVAVACALTNGSTGLLDVLPTAARGTSAVILSLANGCDYDLTAINNSTFGNSGTPVILNPAGVTILGNGSTIERATSATDDFRILTVGPAGSLTVVDTTIAHGSATCAAASTTWCTGSPAPSVAASGGGIAVIGGTLDLAGSTLTHDRAACAAQVCTEAAGGGIGAQDYVGTPVLSPVVAPASATVTVADSAFTDDVANCDDNLAAATCGTAAGGAIDATNSTLRVLRSKFSGNAANCTNNLAASITTCASAYGGAVDATTAAADPSQGFSIVESELLNNTAATNQSGPPSSAYAGAIGGAVALLNNEVAALVEDTISANTASGTFSAAGGGVAAQTTSPLTITGGSIDHNTAAASEAANSSLQASAYGGGLAVGGLDATDVSVSYNTAKASSAYGGGMALGGNGSVQFSGGSVDHNTATAPVYAAGGGVEVQGIPTAFADGSIADNLVQVAQGQETAAVGGGLDAEYLFSTVSLQNEHVLRNRAVGQSQILGGGLAVQTGILTVHGGAVDNNLVSSPSADDLDLISVFGGGIANYGASLYVAGKTQVSHNRVDGQVLGLQFGFGGGIGTEQPNSNEPSGTDVDPSTTVTDNQPDQCTVDYDDNSVRVTGC